MPPNPKWLLAQETYAVTAPSRKKVDSTPVVVAGLNAQFSIDLIDFSQYAKDNDKYKGRVNGSELNFGKKLILSHNTIS